MKIPKAHKPFLEKVEIPIFYKEGLSERKDPIYILPEHKNYFQMLKAVIANVMIALNADKVELKEENGKPKIILSSTQKHPSEKLIEKRLGGF